MIFEDTVNELKKVAQKFDVAIISYSGGKDSMVVTDLCAKIFDRIVGFYMWTVPGLELIERQIAYAKQRWNMDVFQYPNIMLGYWLSYGTYCDPRSIDGILTNMKLKDMYELARNDLKAQLIVTGQKSSDSMQRKRNLSAKQKDVYHPLKKWKKIDVIAYCKMNDIPLPSAAKGMQTTGVGLDKQSLLWLHDEHPEDFRRLLKLFPYAEVPIYRRKFFEKKEQAA